MTRLTLVVLLMLKGQGGGMPNGHIYAFLQCDPYTLNLEAHNQLLAVMETAGLINPIRNHWVELSDKGRSFIGELATMASKDKAATATKKTPEELQEVLVGTIAKFPTEFKLKDHKGVCIISPSKSSVDPETGEESIAVVDKKGELVGEFTAKDLNEKLLPVKGGKAGKRTTGATKNGKEPHVERMRRLLVAGATDEEIFTEFKKVFRTDPRRGTHENSTDDGAIRRRIYLYKWRCADRYEDAKKVLEGRKETRGDKTEKAPKKKAAKGKKATAKGKAGKKSKKADKKAAEKSEEATEE